MKKFTLHTRIHFLKCQSFSLGLLFALTKQRWFFERKIKIGIVLLSLINLLNSCTNRQDSRNTTSSHINRDTVSSKVTKERTASSVEHTKVVTQFVTCYDTTTDTTAWPVRSNDSIIHSKKSFVTDQTETLCYVIAEEMPEFADGNVNDYINKHLIYPKNAFEKGIEGRVITQFVIDSTGCISDVQVVRGVDPELDTEAVRIMQSMPKWIPGKQGDKPVRVKYILPVTFKLPKETK